MALPTLRDELGINALQIGALMSAREVAGGLVSLPGGGILSDRARRLGLVLATTMAGFGARWSSVGLAPTYAWLILGMMVVAISGSLWLCRHDRYHKPSPGNAAMALSIHGVGGNIGDVSGPIADRLLAGLPFLARTRQRLCRHPFHLAAIGTMGLSR